MTRVWHQLPSQSKSTSLISPQQGVTEAALSCVGHVAKEQIDLLHDIHLLAQRQAPRRRPVESKLLLLCVQLQFCRVASDETLLRHNLQAARAVRTTDAQSSNEGRNNLAVEWLSLTIAGVQNTTIALLNIEVLGLLFRGIDSWKLQSYLRYLPHI